MRQAILELASVFVPVVVHRGAVALLQAVFPATNVDSSLTRKSLSKRNSLYVAPEEGANALLHPKPPLPQVSVTHGVVEQPVLPISVQLLEQHVEWMLSASLTWCHYSTSSPPIHGPVPPLLARCNSQRWWRDGRVPPAPHPPLEERAPILAKPREKRFLDRSMRLCNLCRENSGNTVSC